jgi:lipid A 3-O-deacylase
MAFYTMVGVLTNHNNTSSLFKLSGFYIESTKRNTKDTLFLMKILSFLFVLFNLYSLSGSAQSGLFKDEFGFKSDNDAYLANGQDRYYTNGLFITFRRAMDQSRLTGKVNKRIWEAEAGQKMYNPISGRITRASRIDRPFAAYLYAGGSLNWFYNSENSLKITIQGGTIGPSALGKQVQVFLHKLAGFYEVLGWDTQVKDELGLNTSIEYNRFVYRNRSKIFDFTINSYADIGNTFSGAGAGFTFRVGILNQLFNSASANSTISNKPVIKPLTNQELFVYTKNRFTINFSLLFNTKEIESSAKPDQYGSIAFYYRFI